MRWIVTGVFVSAPWMPEPIERTVEAEHADMATSIVDCEALHQGKLFLSAQAKPA